MGSKIEEIRHKRISKNKSNGKEIMLQIVAKKIDDGRRRYYEKKYSDYDWEPDRLLFIKLIDLENNNYLEFPYNYDDQIALFENVMKNIILKETFYDEISKFQASFHNLLKEREIKDKNENP